MLDGSKVPYYTRTEPPAEAGGFACHTDEWAAIVFYRDPACPPRRVRRDVLGDSLDRADVSVALSPALRNVPLAGALRHCRAVRAAFWRN